MAKLLENRFFMIGIIAIVTLAVLVVMNLGEGKNPDVPDNPVVPELIVENSQCEKIKQAYKQLECYINEYKKTKKWNTGKYKIIQSNIKSYVDLGEIDKKQQQKLSNLLISKHLLLLKDTVVQFCLTAKYGSKIDKLDKDLKKFESQPIAYMTDLVKKYKKFRNTCFGIASYINKQYNYRTFNNYEKILLEYELMEHFSNNKSIQTTKDKYINLLSDHKNADKSLKRIDISFLIDYDKDTFDKEFSKKYRRFKYYKTKFDSISLTL